MAEGTARALAGAATRPQQSSGHNARVVGARPGVSRASFGNL